MSDEALTAEISSRSSNDMSQTHADLPVWNAAAWFHEDFAVGQKICILIRTVSESESMAVNTILFDCTLTSPTRALCSGRACSASAGELVFYCEHLKTVECRDLESFVGMTEK